MTNYSTSTKNTVDHLTIIEIKPDYRFSLGVLKEILPDVETLLFFGKLYELDYTQLSHLMWQVLDSDLATELSHGDHSTELQDYLIEIVDVVGLESGNINFSPDVPQGEILPELWKSLELEVATSIKEVAAKLKDAFHLMPGKQGSMLFKTMAKMNRLRPTIGDYQAYIHHAPQKENLVILDVSGSMTQTTITNIVDDVVALSYMANAHLAIVSDSATHWEPGTYGVDDILSRAEFGGTHYETLLELMQRDWGVVVTIADYDSSPSARTHLRQFANGHIDTVLDISLVNRPTFLAECVGQFADDVRPLLIANSYYPISA